MAGRALGVPELQVLAVAAAFLLVAGIVWAALLPSGLEFDRVVRPVMLPFGHQGESVLRVTHRGRLRTPPLHLTDHAPTTLVDDPVTTLSPLAPGEQVEVRTVLHGRQRGRARLGPVVVRATDAFGLAVRTRTLAADGTITVTPAVIELPPGLPLGGSTTTAVDRRRRATVGGDELADIREYVRGDDLRAVHWPSTAHRGRLMVRRTESTQAPAATVVLDRRSDVHRGRGPDATIEVAVRAAASACRHLVDRNRAVTLLDGPLLEPPRAQPWDVLLTRLAETQPGAVDHDRLLRQLGDGAAGDGALIMIGAVTDAVQLRAVVRSGRPFTSRAILVLDTGPGDGDELSADQAVSALRAAGWRASRLGGEDRLPDRWRELVAGARAGGRRTPATAGDHR
ncbi:MAG: DUF58 domain-containing protein [Nitriliruptoraceae bacterium]|nr:DUF58 domain-containing protein [Nitriliruptoraceae bacterium]